MRVLWVLYGEGKFRVGRTDRR